MKVGQIYRKFGIPPNLREHMLRVAGVVAFIENHWSGKVSVDWGLTKKAALIHDLGNIVKFDLEKFPDFLGKEKKNIEHWRKIQVKTIKKYGTDDHRATGQILKDLGVDQGLIKIIMSKSFGNSVKIKASGGWPLKILYYADLRTLPHGIGSLEERIADVRKRMPKYAARPDFEDLVGAGREIERQIQQNLRVPVSRINNVSVNKETGDSMLVDV